MPFDSPDENLGDLLKDVQAGKVQLPDFQREWKWDVDRIGSLLASVSLDHPVGVMMMLEVGADGVRFQPRPIAGTEKSARAAPERLLLDGQQRATSLFQALRSDAPVATKDAKGKHLRRWFYIKMAVALNPEADREEAIVAVPEDRIVRSDFGRVVEADYSSIDRECREEVFPVSRALDVASLMEWQNRYIDLVEPAGETATARFRRFYEDVLGNFVKYTVPVIVLRKETPKEAVCTVFEKVNTGGVVLNVFELLTATYAADDFRLNDDWKARRERLAKKDMLKKLESTDFLQAVSLVATYRRRAAALHAGTDGAAPAVSCRRKDILQLTLDDYQANADAVTGAFEWVARFLAFEKIFRADDVPYRTQMVPLAALRVILGSKVDEYAWNQQLRRWLWCGVLGELYGGAIETRFARDVEQVPMWLQGGDEPRTVYDASFDASRLETLRTRNSAAYKGIYALLMKRGARDWMKAIDIDVASFFDLSIDIHHIFPRKWCDDRGIEPGRRDSIVNKTPLSWDTNRSIGGRAPSSYLRTIQSRNGLSDARLEEMLTRHLVEDGALREDDFESFYEKRRNSLLAMISEVMGKEVRRDDLAPAEAPEYDLDLDLADPEEELAEVLAEHDGSVG
jgi:hypothetical protein